MIHQLSLMLSYRIGGDGGGDFGEVEWDCFRVINIGIEGRTKIGRWLSDHHILKYDIDSNNNSRARCASAHFRLRIRFEGFRVSFGCKRVSLLEA